jgi:predicted membrane-bound spermidine synthase
MFRSIIRTSRESAGATLLALAFLSGICGLAYEVLYARLLSSYLGNIFYVTAAILISFLISYGVGALIAHRYVRLLPYVEIAIGLYGVFFATFIGRAGFSLTAFAASVFGGSPFALIVTSSLLLIVPALLIGFSVPLFTLYLAYYRSGTSEFQRVYFFYNMGAALAVLLIEFVLIRTVGIHASIVSIALINGVIGLLLLFVPPPPKTSADEYLPKETTTAEWLALFLAGIGSGVFQIFIIRLSYFIFGPLNENFSIILSSGLFGIAFGSLLAMTRLLSFRTLLLISAIATFVPLLLLEQFTSLYSVVVAEAIPYNLEPIVKIVFILMLTFPIFTLYGATIPHLVRGVKQEHIARYALAFASFGNATGYVLFVFVLYERVPEYAIAAVAALLFAAGSTLLNMRIRYAVVTAVVIGLFSVVAATVWPSYILDVGYRAFYAPENVMTWKAARLESVTFKKFSSSATISTHTDGSEVVSLDGYVSLRFRADGGAKLNETIVGFVPALFSRERGRALVFGLATGITAGATATVYDETTVAEINPAMLQLTEYFTKDNFDVLNNSRATIELQDGVLVLFKDEQRYDAIINTVPSPTFFSANKLWTKDVFDIVASKLSDGGVFVGWIDSYLDIAGIAIMHNTLKESFADCVYVFLNASYISFVCGNEPLVFTPREDTAWPTSVQEQFKQYALQTSISEFIWGLLLNPGPLTTVMPSTRTNTLDLPLLEFVHASNLDTVNEQMYEFLRLSFPLHPFNENLLSLGEQEKRCAALHILARAFPLFCVDDPAVETL